MGARAGTFTENSSDMIKYLQKCQVEVYLRVTCAVKVTGVPSGLFRQRRLESSFQSSARFQLLDSSLTSCLASDGQKTYRPFLLGLSAVAVTSVMN